MDNYTIQETFTLPSKGKIYGDAVPQDITLRSMQLIDEMRMTSPSTYQYKSMCDTIENCIVGGFPIHVYDMCIGDYQFLMHKLRVVTYGNTYPFATKCTSCGTWTTQEINLDELQVLEYDESFDNLKIITLPQCGKQIELNFQTPRMLDEIERKRNERLAKDSEQLDPRLELMLKSVIAKVDGKILTYVQLDTFINKLSMKDINYIIKSADKLNGRIGIDTTIGCHCSKCRANYLSTFCFTPEFYSPSID